MLDENPQGKKESNKHAKPLGLEIVLSSPTSPKEEETPGQLPPLASIDGKAINQDFHPFVKTPAWEPSQSQAGTDEHHQRTSWRQLWKGKLPKGTQLRIARGPFSDIWCDQWFNSLQTLEC